MKRYLKSYECEMYQALNSSGVTYLLDIESVSWFGLSRKRQKIRYEVPFYSDLATYTAHWDELIKTQKPILK